MRQAFQLVFVAMLALGATRARALDLTVENKSVNAGDTLSLNVTWSSVTPLIYLTTEFIITPVVSAPSGGIYFTNTSGVPAMPPLANSNYVFYNDSSDVIDAPGSNPASVYPTNWAADTYNMADSTYSNTEYTQDGNRLWTVLNLTTTGLAAGQYQIILGNSSFDNNAATGQTPTMTGGLITINSVPEPGVSLLAAIASGVLAGAARRRKRRHA